MIEKLPASSRTEPYKPLKGFQITNMGNITDIPFHIRSVVCGEPVLSSQLLIVYSRIEPLVENLFKTERRPSSLIGQSIHLPGVGGYLPHQFIEAEWKE